MEKKVIGNMSLLLQWDDKLVYLTLLAKKTIDRIAVLTCIKGDGEDVLVGVQKIGLETGKEQAKA